MLFEPCLGARADVSPTPISPRGLLETNWSPPIKLIDGADHVHREIAMEFLRHTSSEWPGSISERLLQSLVLGRGGILLVHAPSEELAKLKWEVTDGGYRTRCVQQMGLWSVMEEPRKFDKLLAELSEHVADDVWPPNIPGAGLTQDAGWGISASGCIRMVAVKFCAEKAPLHWPDAGVRHTTALNIAHALNCGVVLVRSESGKLHVISASGAKEGRVCCTSVGECVRSLEPSKIQANIQMRFQNCELPKYNHGNNLDHMPLNYAGMIDCSICPGLKQKQLGVAHDDHDWEKEFLARDHDWETEFLALCVK